ncbi:DUF6887 family protein [Floridanema evergladense]|uniref:Uncharacterized protein n=1 Tax=Floridaenema evergladense BLCC-F167 TaxID=3153639 RepID=A0ABV4WU96_9CYAN
MKPNFENMSKAELKAYILAHRNDNEAIHALFSRRTPDSEATIYPCIFTEEGLPIEENIRIAEEAIRQRVEAENNRKKDSHS